jgi:hypothetical protein
MHRGANVCGIKWCIWLRLVDESVVILLFSVPFMERLLSLPRVPL